MNWRGLFADLSGSALKLLHLFILQFAEKTECEMEIVGRDKSAKPLPAASAKELNSIGQKIETVFVWSQG